MEDKDFLDQDPQWEQMDTPAEELHRVKKLLQKHDRKTIVKSIAVIGALVLIITFVLVPLMEAMYWSPAEQTMDQYNTDLSLVLTAYTELFLPGRDISFMWSDKGFAEYELHATLYDAIHDQRQYLTGTLRRNTIGFDREFFDELDLGLFPYARFWDSYPQAALDKELEEVRAQLNQLPEYIELEAAITFSEDLTMEQLMQLRVEHHSFSTDLPLEFIWAAIRTQALDEETVHRASGISFIISRIEGGINELYPEFVVSIYEPSGANLEQHYKSLLKFSSDQMAKGHAVIQWHKYNYYEEALAYVEENGVKTYGCIVTGSPQALLKLMDSDIIKDLQLVDGWIHVE